MSGGYTRVGVSGPGRVLRAIRRHGPGAACRGALLALVRLLGEPLPVERRWLEHHGLSAPPERLHGDEGFADWALDCCAPAVAADLSIDPVWTGWPDHVQVEGQALIARTDAGRHQSALRGCHVVRL